MARAHTVSRLAAPRRGGACVGLLALLLAGAASAASSVRIPPGLCGVDAGLLFADGFDGTPAWSGDPSNGSGGAFPGAQTRTITVPPHGTRDYWLYLPAGYTATRAWPLLVALHGAAPPGMAATYAQNVRNDWGPIADANGVIVIAVANSGANGGWVPQVDGAFVFGAMADAEAAYDVDRTRRHVWGFSAGGHYAHGLVLYSPDPWAGYAVNAGVLRAYAGETAPAGASRVVPLSSRVGTSDPLRNDAFQDFFRFVDAGWSAGSDLNFAEFSGGHLYTGTDLAAHWAFLCPFAVAP
jgi:poly(3-hydroxybutyrate) depolymerase